MNKTNRDIVRALSNSHHCKTERFAHFYFILCAALIRHHILFFVRFFLIPQVYLYPLLVIHNTHIGNKAKDKKKIILNKFLNVIIKMSKITFLRQEVGFPILNLFINMVLRHMEIVGKFYNAFCGRAPLLNNNYQPLSGNQKSSKV